jgi:hypothetical protein
LISADMFAGSCDLIVDDNREALVIGLMAHTVPIVGSTLVARSVIGGFRCLSARVPIDRQAVRRIGVRRRRVLDALGKLLPHGARRERGDDTNIPIFRDLAEFGIDEAGREEIGHGLGDT